MAAQIYAPKSQRPPTLRSAGGLCFVWRIGRFDIFREGKCPEKGDCNRWMVAFRRLQGYLTAGI